MGEVINMDKFKRQRSLSLSMLLLLAEQLGRDIEDTRRNIAHDYRMGWLTQEEREWLLVAVESLPPLPVSDDEQGPAPRARSRRGPLPHTGRARAARRDRRWRRRPGRPG
jgi:hypothetical protein